jgi:hypothetical protein
VPYKLLKQYSVLWAYADTRPVWPVIVDNWLLCSSFTCFSSTLALLYNISSRTLVSLPTFLVSLPFQICKPVNYELLHSPIILYTM